MHQQPETVGAGAGQLSLRTNAFPQGYAQNAPGYAYGYIRPGFRLGKPQHPHVIAALHGTDRCLQCGQLQASVTEGNLDKGIQATALGMRVASFLCPSSGLPVGNMYSCLGVAPFDMIRYPGNNYWGSVGPCTTPWASAKPPGIFFIVQEGGQREPLDRRHHRRHQQYDRLRRMEDGRLQFRPALPPGCDQYLAEPGWDFRQLEQHQWASPASAREPDRSPELHSF